MPRFTLILTLAVLASCARVDCPAAVEDSDASSPADADALDCEGLSCETDADCNTDRPYCVKGACQAHPV